MKRRRCINRFFAPAALLVVTLESAALASEHLTESLTAPVLDELRSGSFTGRDVRVSGVQYSSTGAILVHDIWPRT